MPIDRPTFSESWYRVAELRPRLRTSVQAGRHHFRGQSWYVLRDPANNEHFRLNAPAYRFVSLLDGRRTVADVWRICNDQLGDSSPTQGEAIGLMGQLYSSNLIQADVPPDAEGLFRRYKTRKQREMQGYLSNLLFIRLPLFDPDRFLNAFLPMLGWIFSWAGFLVWAALVGTGLYYMVGRMGELTDKAKGILDLGNLPILYAGTILAKVFHEFGHALACKKFGRQEGAGHEVHVMGVMFLVFTPLPYVDVSSSWTFRSKWRRAMVGAAGMVVELAVAAIAAVVWTHTAQGSPANAVAYNIIFIAGVSTLLFNGNPLLRYDAYYILSDLLEIPNLAQRSKDYIYYLVRKHAWGVRQARSPAQSPGEQAWMLVYGIASFLYRTVICVAILLFVADKLLLLGTVLAAGAVIAWVVVPLGKFLKYLASSQELSRTRGRAVLSTLLVVAAACVAVGLVPAPDRVRIDGVVEPVEMAIVYAGEDGFARELLPSGADVKPDGATSATRENPELEADAKPGGTVLARLENPELEADAKPGGTVLARLENPELEAEIRRLQAKREELEARRRLARTTDLAAAQVVAEQMSAIDEGLARLRQRQALLVVRAPMAGQWVAPQIDHLQGAYVHRGDRLGTVVRTDRLLVRATADQQVAAQLIAEANVLRAEVQVLGRPDPNGAIEARIERIGPAGVDRLPSASLGYLAGGSILTSAEDPNGTKSVERVFEVRAVPLPRPDVRLLIGQRVVMRLEMPKRSLAAQWWHSIQQVFQKRFHVA
jgi:putative peptide zinc metalloprotease protein